MSLKTFTTEALKDFSTTGSLAPSSRFLAEAMLSPLPLAQARCVVEFGPGTGTMTRALLKALPADALLLSFEVNPRFCAFLRRHFSDPRLTLLPVSAERVGKELAARGIGQVAAALSSLSLTFMRSEQRHAILRGLLPFLGPTSVFTQYQYLHASFVPVLPTDGRVERFAARPFLRRYFPQVSRETVWRNFPPASVFTCRR